MYTDLVPNTGDDQPTSLASTGRSFNSFNRGAAPLSSDTEIVGYPFSLFKLFTFVLTHLVLDL